MAVIRPFQALKFDYSKAGDPSELTCPPYDIVSETQRAALLQRNPNNIIRLELPVGENAYRAAGDRLRKMLDTGVLTQEQAPAIYIYSEQFCHQGKSYRFNGIVARVGLAEFSERVVLPHEHTLSKAKEDRLNLIKATGCSFSQVYSLFFDRDRKVRSLIDAVVSGEPEVCFADGEGVTHRLWTVTEPSLIASVAAAFADKQLFIADGHHRYETALNFRRELREQGAAVEGEHPANSIMMTLVDIEDEGLVVLPTHRLVRGVENFDAARYLREWSEEFDIERRSEVDEMETVLSGCGERPSFGAYFGGGEWYLLRLRGADAMRRALPGQSEAYRGLDVAVLHTLVLDKLGITPENMAQQKNLTYTKQLSDAVEGVRTGGYQAAFVLNATRVAQIAAVAEAGEVMPQKSTYFYPKLITGLVMNRIFAI